MKLTLAICLLVTAAKQVAAQFYIDYYFVTTNGCTGVHQGCDNIASGICCSLNSAPSFFTTAKTGSYGPVGFTVWTQTDNSGSYCGNCATTTGFGCWQNENPFETAYIVGIPVGCRNGVVRRSIDMTSSDDAAAANAVEPAPRCTHTVLPNRLGIDGREYAITDENREEIVHDLITQANLTTDFAEKWKSAYIGPTDLARKPPCGEAQKKPRTGGS